MIKDLVPGENSLIIVSNRTPATLSEGKVTIASSGGLVAGLKNIHSSCKSLWLGYCGDLNDEASQRSVLLAQHIIPVKIPTSVYKKYYDGMSNANIWPVCHYWPALGEYRQNLWDAYVHVNELFCKEIKNAAKPGDFIWIQDYHLMLLPNMLRKERPDLNIAYFHHIPFPASEVFRTLPHRQDLLEGLLGADIVGFHTHDYVNHFLSNVTRVLGIDNEMNEIFLPTRSVKVGAFPLGINVTDVKKSAGSAESLSIENNLASLVSGKTVFLGIDRLDYTKGIPQRLLAFSTLLERHPELIGKIILIQICVPSRENVKAYGNLKVEVERMVGNINGKYSQAGYTPIQYLHRSHSPKEVHGFMRIADVALVTPLRDGLNLVCKEFVACKTNSNGVLILSEFAGAASEMGEAILVNPFDIDKLAEAMHQAIYMKPAERQRRMKALRTRVEKSDNDAWFSDYLNFWQKALNDNQTHSEPIDVDSFTKIAARVQGQERMPIFLDYDGSLVPIAPTPEQALPSKALKRIIKSLSAKAEVVIVSGRPKEFFNEHFADVRCHIYAEYGAFYRNAYSKNWRALLSLESFNSISDMVLDTYRSFESKLHGSFIEQKECSLVFHYRQVEPVYGKTQALELREILQQALSKSSYGVFLGKRVVEVRSIICQKNFAVEHFLKEHYTKTQSSIPSFITIGDDTTDEEMYKVARESNISIHVGRRNLHALYSLQSSTEVLKFLMSLAFSPFKEKIIKNQHLTRDNLINFNASMRSNLQ